jgi:hypothetical protein
MRGGGDLKLVFLIIFHLYRNIVNTQKLHCHFNFIVCFRSAQASLPDNERKYAGLMRNLVRAI